MRHPILLPALSVTLLAAAASAQYVGEGPGLVSPGANFAPLTTATVGNNVTQIQQYAFRSHPSLPNGVYYTTMTVVLASKPATDYDLMSGLYDANTDTFTKNTDVDALNTAAGIFAVSVSPDLKVVAYDADGSNKPAFATRSGTTGPFGPAQNMTGVVSNGYVDTHLAQIDGKLKVLYISGNNIMAADFDPATGITSNATTVIAPTTGGAHSPCTLNDANNEAKALVFSINISGSSAYFTSGLDGVTPIFKIHDAGTGWINNPGAMGGRVVYADSTTYATNIKLDLCALSSDVIPSAGGNLKFSAFMPPRPTGAPYVGTVILGSLASSGTPLPFAMGSPLSINLSPIIVLPGGLYNQFTGDLTYAFTTGPLPSGTVVHGIPLALDPTVSVLWVGNTAFYKVQ